MTDDIQVGDLVKLNRLGQSACAGERKAGDEATIESITGEGSRTFYRLRFPDGEMVGLFKADEFDFVGRIIPPGNTAIIAGELAETPDMVNHPPHYKQYGIEVIEITEKLNFCKGNAVKYILRAEFKGNEIEDLEKAEWYIRREIDRIKREAG